MNQLLFLNIHNHAETCGGNSHVHSSLVWFSWKHMYRFGNALLTYMLSNIPYKYFMKQKSPFQQDLGPVEHLVLNLALIFCFLKFSDLSRRYSHRGFIGRIMPYPRRLFHTSLPTGKYTSASARSSFEAAASSRFTALSRAST